MGNDYRKIALANAIDRGINEQTNNLRNAVLAATKPAESKAYLDKVSEATLCPTACETPAAST